MVVDDMFGEGIARGTVPLEHGDGVNVLIDFLGPAQDPKPPASRGAENLKRAPAGRTRTISFTTGTDFDSGAAHRARGRNSHERHASTPQKICVRERRTLDLRGPSLCDGISCLLYKEFGTVVS